MKLSIRCAHGTYVVAEGGGNGAVNANRANAGDWETFKLCDVAGIPFSEKKTVADDALVTFRTFNGQFLYPKWGDKVLANASTPVGAAFSLQVLSGAVQTGGSPVVALRSPGRHPQPGNFSGQYFWVTAEIGGTRPLVANRQIAAPDAWERFTLELSLGTQYL